MILVQAQVVTTESHLEAEVIVLGGSRDPAHFPYLHSFAPERTQRPNLESQAGDRLRHSQGP